MATASWPVSPGAGRRTMAPPRTCVPAVVGPVQRIRERSMAMAWSEHDIYDEFRAGKFDRNPEPGTWNPANPGTFYNLS